MDFSNSRISTNLMQEHFFFYSVAYPGHRAIMAGSFDLQQIPWVAPSSRADSAIPFSFWLMFGLFWRGFTHGDYTSSLSSIFQLLASIHSLLTNKFKPTMSVLKTGGGKWKLFQGYFLAVGLSYGFSIQLVVGDIVQIQYASSLQMLHTVTMPPQEKVENLPATGM